MICKLLKSIKFPNRRFIAVSEYILKKLPSKIDSWFAYKMVIKEELQNELFIYLSFIFMLGLYMCNAEVGGRVTPSAPSALHIYVNETQCQKTYRRTCASGEDFDQTTQSNQYLHWAYFG